MGLCYQQRRLVMPMKCGMQPSFVMLSGVPHTSRLQRWHSVSAVTRCKSFAAASLHGSPTADHWVVLRVISLQTCSGLKQGSPVPHRKTQTRTAGPHGARQKA